MSDLLPKGIQWLCSQRKEDQSEASGPTSENQKRPHCELCYNATCLAFRIVVQSRTKQTPMSHGLQASPGQAAFKK